jgi:hypothetical protein
VNRARTTLCLLAPFAIGWLLVLLSTTAVLAQVGSPTGEVSAGASATAPATASPSVGGVIETGDPRSEGEGPGLVGEPLLVLAGIVLVGLATVIVTIVIARTTGRS